MAKTVRVIVRLDLTEAKKEARELGNVLNEALLKAVNKGVLGEIESLRKSLKKLRDENKKLEIRLDLTDAKRQAKDLERALDKALDLSGGSATAETRKLEKSLAALRRETEKMEKASTKLSTSERRLADAQNNRRKAQGLLSKSSLTSAARARIATTAVGLLAVATYQLQKILVDSAKAAIEYEAGLVRVAKTTDGVLDSTHTLTESGRAISNEFLQMSRVIPVAIDELLKIGEIAGQLGVARSELTRFTELVAGLSRTTDLSVEQAATSFAKLGNVLSLSLGEMEDLADAVVYLGNNFPTTESAIVSFSERIAGAAAVVDLTAASVAGISAAFLSVGATPQAAATAVQKSLLAIETAVAKGGEKLDVFADTAGLTATDFATLWEKDAGQAFTLFVEGLGTQGGEAITTLEKLGLADQRLIRSFLALANAGGLLEESIAGATQASKDGVAATEEAAHQFSTTEASLQDMKNAWEELQISMVNTEGVKAATQAVTNYLNAVSDSEQTINDVRALQDELSLLTGIDYSAASLSSARARSGPVDTDGLLGDELAAIEEYNAAIEGMAVAEAAKGIFQDQIDDADGYSAAMNEQIALQIAFRAALQLTKDDAEITIPAVEALGAEIGQLAATFADGGSITVGDVNQAIAQMESEAEVTARGALANQELAGSIAEVTGARADNALEAELEIQRAEELAAAAELEHAAMTKVRDATLAVAAGFIDSEDSAAVMTLAMIDSATAVGVTNDEMLAMIASSGLFTASQVEVIENSMMLEQAQADLNAQVADGTLTAEEAASKFQRLAEATNLTADATRDLAAEQEARASATATNLTGMIDSTTVSGQLTVSLIEQAQRAGATGLEILSLAAASGELSAEQESAAVNAYKLTLKQQELAYAVSTQAMSYEEARVALIAYADSLNLAGDSMTYLSNASSNYEGALQSVISASGSSGRAADDTKESFRDLFVSVVQGAGDLDELTNTAEDWNDALFDMAIQSGASIEQILALGLATGKLDDEMAGTLLNMAIAQRGVEQIADAYVAGEIGADGAAAAISTLTEQIESGAQIDLSQFGITAADLAQQGKAVEQAAGSAGNAAKTWRDELRALSDEQGLSAAAYAELVKGTTDVSDAQIAAALTQDTITQAVARYAELISAGMSPDAAVADIEKIESALGSLSLTEITGFLDGADDLGRLSAEELLASLEGYLETGDVEIPVSVALDDGSLETVAGLISGLDAEIEATVALSGDSDFNLDQLKTGFAAEAGGDESDPLPIIGGGIYADGVNIPVDGDPSALQESVDTVVDSDYEAEVGADVEPMLRAILDVTEDAKYTTTVDTELDTSGVQAAIDGLDLEVTLKVTADTSGIPSSASPGQPANTGSEGYGYADGGMINGPAHSQGGVFINAEGGEYIINKGAVNSRTIGLLQAINNGQSIGLDAIAATLDGAGQRRFADGGLVGGDGRVSISSVSRTLMAQTAPVTTTTVDNSATIDQSRATTTHITNNYITQNGRESDYVTGLGNYR